MNTYVIDTNVLISFVTDRNPRQQAGVSEIFQEAASLKAQILCLQNVLEISKMLQEEESPANYFEQGVEYPVFTPLGQEKAAAQLQAFLDREKSSQKQSITI